MARMKPEKDLKNKTIEQLQLLMEKVGGKNFMAGYVFDFIHAKDFCDIGQMTTLSLKIRNDLSGDGYFISKLKLKLKKIAEDNTTKYLFELNDKNLIEAVMLFDDERKTVCISTQAGCAMNCKFCATAKMGFIRDLTVAEIVEQVYAIKRDGQKITNIVFMGMGEPLANYDNVIASVEILNHEKGQNFAIRKITVSTCGISNRIMDLAYEKIRPRLAISLNAIDNNTRTKIMPINKQFPLPKLFASIVTYQKVTGQRVTFEYVLINGVNDSEIMAEKMAKKLKGFNCNINLIEYNSHKADNFQPCGLKKMKRFAGILKKAGLTVSLRQKQGNDIQAACGQLAAKQK